MSFDVDRKEFHETFDEMVADPQYGLQGAKNWAWSALSYAQTERALLEKQLRETEAVIDCSSYFRAVAWLVYASVRVWVRKLRYASYRRGRKRNH